MLVALVGLAGAAQKKVPFGPFDIRDWKSVDVVTGRPATQADIDAGRAVFLVDGPTPSKPVDVGLPRCAIWHNRAVKKDIPVVVIQAEEVAGGLQMAGVRFLAGDKTVCLLKDLILLAGPDERFGTKEPNHSPEPPPSAVH